jgi:hypothetical protein
VIASIQTCNSTLEASDTYTHAQFHYSNLAATTYRLPYKLGGCHFSRISKLNVLLDQASSIISNEDQCEGERHLEGKKIIIDLDLVTNHGNTLHMTEKRIFEHYHKL